MSADAFAETACFRERAVFLPDPSALVLADLHLGRDASSGVALPVGERRDVSDRLDALVEWCRPSAVVFAGDVVHEFGPVTREDLASLDDLAARCTDRGASLRVVAGNHDAGLAAASEALDGHEGGRAAGWDGTVHDAVTLSDGTVVCHGHEEPAVEGPRYILGHDHPTLAVEGRRHPCFLWGPGTYADGDVLVLPAFTRLAAGVDVGGMTTADFQSPLVTDADALRPLVYDPGSDEALRFPSLGRFRAML